MEKRGSYIIVDLDGTLSDHSHRIDLARERAWEEYNSMLIFDTPHMDVVDFLADMAKVCEECQFIILTARDEKWRQLTFQWLFDNNIAHLFDTVLMRPTGDFTSDSVLKPQLLFDHFGSKEEALKNVRMILEDRDNVVKAWREHGLVAWQVREAGHE